MDDTSRTGLARVLAVGTPADQELRTLATRRWPGGLLIILDEDAARLSVARQYAADDTDGTTTVIAGDPRRMMYKLSGPFDVIYCRAEYQPLVGALAQRLLAPGGVIITSDHP